MNFEINVNSHEIGKSSETNFQVREVQTRLYLDLFPSPPQNLRLYLPYLTPITTSANTGQRSSGSPIIQKSWGHILFAPKSSMLYQSLRYDNIRKIRML